VESIFELTPGNTVNLPLWCAIRTTFAMVSNSFA